MIGLRDMAWGPWLVYLLLGAGVLFSALTLLVQLRGLPRALGLELRKDGGRPSQTQRRLLAGGAGMGSLAGAALAVTVAGPGAVLWMWIATLLGMAVTFSEATLGAAVRRDGGDGAAPGPMVYLRPAFGSLGPVVAVVLGLGTIAAALTAGAMFQSHQAAALLRASFGTLPLAGAALVAVLAAPFVVSERMRATAVDWAPALVAVYVALAVVAVGSDVAAAGEALTAIVSDAFGPEEAAGGVAGAATALAIQHGLLRATFAGESGLGTAAFADPPQGDRPVDAGLRAMLAPAITSGLIGTLTALIVVSPDGVTRRAAPAQLLPLEVHESRGLLPSAQVGQTVVLPEDTKLEPNKRYTAILRSNPRGHRVGQHIREKNAVVLPKWEVAADTDTIVFRDADRERRKSAGWDVRVPVESKVITIGDAEFYELTPTDPETVIHKLIARKGLDGPFVALGDFHFVGTVARATAPDEKIGEHLALFERRADDAPSNPKFHELFRIGYRGPYIQGEAERPPWGFAAEPGVSAPVGSVLRLRMRSPARGANVGRLTQLGAIEAPPWDFVMGTTTAVIRSDEGPAGDIRVPVRGELRDGRIRFESSDPQWADFRVVEEEMEGFTGPYLVTPPYDFQVEVHTGTRLPGQLQQRRSLVPIHPLGEPVGPAGAELYTPHPGEIVTTDMEGPFFAADGVEVVASRVASRLGSAGRAVLAIVALLFAVTTIAVWSSIGARVASHVLGRAGALVVQAAALGCAATATLLGFAQVLELADVSIAAMAAPNVLALLLLSPRLVAEIRKGITPRS